MRILIIESSHAMQNLIETAIKDRLPEAQFVFESNGNAALERVSQSNPDLIICATQVKGESGIDIVRSLRWKNNRTRVILLSIREDEPEISTLLNPGTTARLEKPFTPKQLGNLAFELLKSRISPQRPPRELIVQILPEAITALERILGNLAKSPIIFQKSDLDSIDYSSAPFYACTLKDNQHKVVLALFLDIHAAAIITAVFRKRKLSKRASLVEEGIDDTTRKILYGFMALFCGLFRVKHSDQLLKFDKDSILQNPGANLPDYVASRRKSSTVYSVQSKEMAKGTVIIVFP